MFSCNRPMCLCKSQTHVSNYCKFQLSSDIEKNPGPTPMYIDPSKTITAPYSQANELVFGQNSGQQCVAMSLSSLMYNNKQGTIVTSHAKTFLTVCRFETDSRS